MEDLQTSIAIMFGQLPSSEEQRHNAACFCNEFVENNYKNWQAFFGSIVDPANSEIVRFFFLQALTDIVKDKFNKRYERPQCIAFNQSVVDLIKAHPDFILCSNHFRSKYSQLIALIYFESGYQSSLNIAESH
jgi:hypothetical protein